MIAKTRPEDEQGICFIHEVTGDRRAAAAKHPTTERMLIRDQALAFKRRQHWTVERLG
jgi:hypothetical protein